MKKLFLTIVCIMVAFAILLPFASKNPDGLETLVEKSANQQEPAWKGLMGNYSVALADPYVSTLIAGLFGTSMVIIASFLLGLTITQKKKPLNTQVPG